MRGMGVDITLQSYMILKEVAGRQAGKRSRTRYVAGLPESSRSGTLGSGGVTGRQSLRHRRLGKACKADPD